jgi:hypothetical protein
LAIVRPETVTGAQPPDARARRAWFILGALIGPALVLGNLPAKPLSAMFGAAQGVLFCSLAFGPRIQRIGVIAASLAAIAALALYLLGVRGFEMDPSGTA